MAASVAPSYLLIVAPCSSEPSAFELSFVIHVSLTLGGCKHVSFYLTLVISCNTAKTRWAEKIIFVPVQSSSGPVTVGEYR